MEKFSLVKFASRITGLLLLFISFAPLHGQDAAVWTNPKFLGDGWWQSAALDQEGNFHVSWYGGYSVGDKLTHDVLYYSKLSSDGVWSSPLDAVYTGDGGFTVRNAITVTSDGMLNVAYRGGVNHYLASAPVVGSDTAANWKFGTQLGADGYYLDMIADQDDNLQLVVSERNSIPNEDQIAEVFAEGAQCFLCFDLFYMRSEDGGASWSDQVPLSLEVYSGSDRPQIQQGASGRLYVTWDEGLDWYVSAGTAQDVRMVYSDDRGRTWSKPIIFTGSGQAGYNPIMGSMTEMRDGSLMMIWRYATDFDRNIYYQISKDVGLTWSEPAPVPGIITRTNAATSLDHYELVTDRLGTVHLFAVGQTDSPTQRRDALYDITYVPSSEYWVQPQRIYYSADERPEWPEAIVGPANDIHLVWFNRGVIPGSNCNTCILKVYYSHLPGSMAAEPTRQFRPTITPLPTATVFINIEPSSTPVPTVQNIEQNLMVSTADNYISQSLLGGMFLSALFCAAVLIFIRLRR